MSNELIKNIGELNGSVKNYVQAKIDLVKLSFIEKMTRITAYLINFLVIVLFFMLIIGFGAAVFSVWYGQIFDNYMEGLLISCGGLVVLVLLFILLRKKIITASLIRNFSQILLEDDENKVK